MEKYFKLYFDIKEEEILIKKINKDLYSVVIKENFSLKLEGVFEYGNDFIFCYFENFGVKLKGNEINRKKHFILNKELFTNYEKKVDSHFLNEFEKKYINYLQNDNYYRINYIFEKDLLEYRINKIKLDFYNLKYLFENGSRGNS